VSAIDTNILVYAHREDSLFHEAAFRRVVELAEGPATWAIPWSCVHEFPGHCHSSAHLRAARTACPGPRPRGSLARIADLGAFDRVGGALADIAGATRRRPHRTCAGP